MKILGAAAAVILIAGAAWYLRLRPAEPALTGTVAICAKDFAELPGDHVAKRCHCVIDALGKTADGREVLKLIEANGHFLRTIESASSHSTVLDAMNDCGR